MKAADAQTVGGLPASAFVLAAPSNPTSASTATPSTAAQPLAPGTTPATTAGGTVNKLAKFDATADITNSLIFDNGTNVGIGNTAPAAKLDVSGSAAVRGTLTLPATGAATATAGKNSQAVKLTASVFNSGTGTAVAENFQLQAEPAGNNTSGTSGTLNLLYSTGTNKLAETGLKIASNGQLMFAAGRTFPGTGNGTITGVTAGTDLTGGGSSGNVTLSLGTTKVVTGVTAGTDLTGGGTGGVLTLSLDTTKVPQLAAGGWPMAHVNRTTTTLAGALSKLRLGGDFLSPSTFTAPRTLPHPEGRVAQAFDLAGITNTVGAPSFAHFAKGGSRAVAADNSNHITGLGYDASGNTLSDGPYSYTWDAESEMKTAARV